MKQVLFIAVILVAIAFGAATVYRVFWGSTGDPAAAANFEECVTAGYVVMESYPRQCKTRDGTIFVEDIGNELEKADLIRVTNPRLHETIASPLVLKGEARGFWFFEASFPVRLFDGAGREIAVAVAQAQGEWMTTEFVPFQATLEFVKPATAQGTLIFEKDNPSGLPQEADSLTMPIRF